MLNLTNISVSFGGRDLYKNISFQINPKDKIGIAGKNGAGKSTMLKLITGDQLPSSGQINITKSMTIGYLPQELNVDSQGAILSEVLAANKRVFKINNRLEAINKELTVREDYESDAYMELLNELSDLNEELLHHDGDNQLKEAELLLKGLGFEQKELQMPYASFSGGWKMRVELAKLLIQKPSIVLLDEPTNHLDIESIQWLEKYLKQYVGIILLISHDRKFLDNITNRTIELSNGKLYDYKCNYSKYLVLREEEIITQIAAKKNQEKMVKHTQELINKFRAKKNKAAFAQSLIKKLDKLEDIEVDQLEKDSIKFQFPEPSHSGKETLKIKNLKKKYPDKTIFSGVDLSISRGEKIALIGKNGMGKSTLIKTIVDDVDFDGSIELGHNVMLGYFAQDEAHKLNPQKTVFETIDDVDAGEIRKKVRQILGSFLFSGDDSDKKVQVLSGGEKTRLSLCKLLLQPNNFLILDEPTNHLDMVSKEILKEALISYSGTLLIVSHDRDFLDGLTDRVYFIKEKDVKIYHEPVSQFIESYYGASTNDQKTVAKKKKEVKPNDKKVQNKQKSLERKITQLEQEQADLEFQMYKSNDQEIIVELQKKIKKVKQEIEGSFENLMSLSD
jgi:ATP-binding cassette subfamily F protein 3